MAQIANRNNGSKTSETAKNLAAKTADLVNDTAEHAARVGEDTAKRLAHLGQDAVEQARPQAARLVQDARSAVEQLTARSAQAAQRTLDSAAPAAREVLAGERDLASLWLGAVREQVQANLETLQRLAAVRDWREAVEVQSEYVRGSISRSTDLLRRHVAVAGRVLQAGGQLKVSA